MLQLEIEDRSGRLDMAALARAQRASAPLLTRCCAGEARYADSLGWLDTKKWAGEQVLAEIESLAAEIRKKADVLIVIGVGGSNNAARAVERALVPRGTRLVYAGNTLSPYEMNALLAELEGHEIYLDCIAKNFETLEPGAAFRILREYLIRRCGAKEAASRICCTGTPGSPLETLCTKENWRFLPFPPDIGGRYTALSCVHLLPLAVAGADIRALARGAAAMEERLRHEPAAENIALRYAAARSLCRENGMRAEMLVSFEPRLRWFYLWWQQLFAESEGKDGKGLLPCTGEFSEQLHSVGQYIQDGDHLLFETFLDIREQGKGDSLVFAPSATADGFGYLDGKDLWQVNKADLAATRAAHSETLPCLTLTMERLNEENFGELFYFFEFSCYLSAGMLGVNPFDQPGVEAYKQRMFRALDR